jgi:hypothetical protein
MINVISKRVKEIGIKVFDERTDRVVSRYFSDIIDEEITNEDYNEILQLRSEYR